MSSPDPLVIVIGAGASKEVNLPVGSELTTAIAETLNLKVDHFGRLEGGDPQVRECIYKLAQDPSNSHGTANEYYETALRIREAMPLAPSIDNFIDSHRTDIKVAQLGKLAIAACILEAEKKSSLHVDRSTTYNKLDFSALSGTWFSEVFRLFSQHCTRDELESRLSRLTVISFNYDRCFKQFLRHALLTYYPVSTAEVNDLISKVTVLYPYGSVGSMRWETPGYGVDYGERPISDDLLRAASAIRTFTESADTYETKAIRECIASTKTLVYLGFAFHPLNMELLYGKTNPPPNSRNCYVLATAFQVSNSNQSLIAEDLARMGGYAAPRIQLHQQLKAGGLVF